ncbi:MAG: DUF1385 domain-containing protein [Clostridia bacterium]|nr:DUF1385 domain-containing protein [Clostridia bacterium]
MEDNREIKAEEMNGPGAAPGTEKKDGGAPVCRRTSIGGQALLEGIMMRGPGRSSIAVRKPDGGIMLETEETAPLSKKINRIPIVRGVYSFVSSMIIGYKALMRSAEIAMPEDEEEGVKPSAAKPEVTPAEAAKTAEQAAETADQAAETAEQAAETADQAAETAEQAAETAEQAAETAEQAAETAEQAAEAAEKTAETAGKSAEAATAAKESADAAGKTPETEKKKNGGMTAVMILSAVLGVALALLLFKVIPEAVYGLLAKLFPGMTGAGYGYSLLRSALTGIMKVMILVGYMAAVSQMKDIKRTFMYHGAEHKSIFCYEKGLELTVDNVRKQIRFHPRCGTSFLVLSVLVSIFFTMFIPAQLVPGSEILNVLARTGISLLLLPVIMGCGYELIKFAGRHDNALTKIISAPGVWLQHITTKEPEDGMIECAIAALKEVIPDDGSDRF